MKHVRVELLSLTGKWIDAGSVAEVEPPGSISSVPARGQREVYLFGWYGLGPPGVWRSEAGYDVANDAARAVVSVQLERLADLEAGPFEMPVWVKGREAQVRFILWVPK